MTSLRRRPRLLGALVALALALAPALPGGIPVRAASGAGTDGYWFVAGDGGIFSFGDATFFGSTGDLRLNQPIVGMAPTPTGRGYWFVAADGGIFSFGDAKFYGSTGRLTLNRPIVGMAPLPSGRGYWFVASDGGIFSFGDAGFYGSTGNIKLAKPIVGMAATPTGGGYWFVASDGGIFNYGDAGFFGSAAGTNLRSPIVSMVATPSGKGYYLAAADGTVVAFGDAVFRGSMGGKGLKSPIVGISRTASGGGYWLVAADGGIFSFGDAKFFGSTGAMRLNRAIVGMAAAPEKFDPALPGGGLPGGGTGGGGNPGGGTGGGGNPGGGTGGGGNPGGGTPPTTLPPVEWGPAGTTLALNVNGRPSGGGGNAYRPWVSGNGRYVVFDSDGKRVIAGETVLDKSIRDVYLYDRTAGTVERITWGHDGSRANIPESDDRGACPSNPNPCGSQRPTISANGEWIAFWSSADNLVPDDTNNRTDAFLYHTVTKTMTRISVGANGQGNGDSRRPVVSRDGSFVVFESAATNLVPRDCSVPLLCRDLDRNNADDVFIYDVANKTVSLVSATPEGGTGNGASNRPTLSGNGRKVAFQSDATDLAAGDNNGSTDVYLRDMASGAMSIVSTGANGLGDKASGSPSLSANGNAVSFDSKATNFIAGDNGGDVDIYVKNLDTGVIEQASLRSDGSQASTSGKAVGADSSISADGRYVTFWSDSANLVDGDTNGSDCNNPPCTDVFVRDMQAKKTIRILSTTGAQGDNDSFSPAISMDGRIVAFDSKANSFDPDVTPNNNQDIFVHVNF